MRISPFLLAFLVAVKFLPAQSGYQFAAPNGQWNIFNQYFEEVVTPYSPGFGTDKYYVSGDTIMYGRNYQVISGFPEHIAQEETLLFIREDSLKRVFINYSSLFDSSDHLLFDFSKTKNDTIRNLASPSNDTSVILVAVVNSVDSIYVGKWRKEMYVTYGQYDKWAKQYSFSSGLIEWLEGTGAVNQFPFEPGLPCYDCGSQFLLCFFEGSDLIYHNTQYTTCDTNPVPNPLLIRVFPNPAYSNLVTVQLNNEAYINTTFQLFDVTGRMVFQKQLSQIWNEVEMPSLAGGVYSYRINSGTSKVTSGKLVVQ